MPSSFRDVGFGLGRIPRPGNMAKLQTSQSTARILPNMHFRLDGELPVAELYGDYWSAEVQPEAVAIVLLMNVAVDVRISGLGRKVGAQGNADVNNGLKIVTVAAQRKTFDVGI